MQEPDEPRPDAAEPDTPPVLPFTVEDIQPIVRTIRLNPLRTTLRMERVFWDELDHILAKAGLTLGEFLGQLVTRMSAAEMPTMTLAAAVRVFVLTASRDGDPFRPRNQA
jgi:predicted DNA-binding ribbon-helix-helix protein